MRDVDNANEAKRTPVLVRMLCLSFYVYFIIALIMILIGGGTVSWIFTVAGFVAYLFPFFASYHGHTRFARNFIIYFTGFWMVLAVYGLGWDCGFQNFCYVILILVYMTGYAPLPAKITGTALIVALRLFIYFYTQNYPAVYQVSPVVVREVQVLNTVMVFFQLTLLVFLFSLDSLESEKKLIAYNDKVKEMASVDPLTGLLNRRGMELYVARQVENTSENEGFLNFAIGDIDFFKKVNDTYGHAAGDDLLKALAELFRHFMKGKGMVARWGGEEFLFLFLGANGDQTMVDLEDLRHQIQSSEFTSGDIKISVTMTFGMQEWTIGESYEHTISAADEKLYRGKEGGRNRVVF